MANHEIIESRLNDIIDPIEVQYNSVREAFIDATIILENSEDVGNNYEEKKRMEHRLRHMRTALNALAMAALDSQKKASWLESGGFLESDEFHQNIKPGNDDAYYGAISGNIELAREIRWPLRLDEFDKQVATMTRGTKEVPTVTAEGTSKYVKTLGDNTVVSIVIDERGRDPF